MIVLYTRLNIGIDIKTTFRTNLNFTYDSTLIKKLYIFYI